MLIAAAAWIFVAADAHAAIVYLSQQRTIRANGFINGISEGAGFLIAPDFGDFNAALTHNFSQGAGTSTSSQFSALRPEGMVVESLARSTSARNGIGFDIDAQSVFNIRFRLDTPTSFRIDHAHTSFSEGLSVRLAVARLSNASGSLFEWQDNSDAPNSWPSSPAFGMLAAGDYTLLIDVRTLRVNGGPVVLPGTTEATASFAFTIPTSTTAPLLGVCIGMQRRHRRKTC
ncbi:MAG: hypothetical protein SGI86_03515 [Deltaproteobacteria bacterium]|nr:hypothetical protein [Deltaproteobacteria bacterium]